MKVTKLKNLVSKVMGFAQKNDSEILAAVALVGLITTGVKAYKAGLKASDILKEKKKDLELVDRDDKETKKIIFKETTKELAPVIIPPIVTGIATAACIIGSNRVKNRRLVMVTTAYNLSETALNDINKKMNDILGEKKARSIKDAIIKDKFEEDPPKTDNTVIVTGDGDVLCKDMYTGRFFRSNAQKIGQAVNELSAECQVNMYVCLNDLYHLLHIPTVPMGNDLGWNVESLMRGQLPIAISAQLTEENVPCLCLDYDIHLRKDFRNLH